jgi:hypothetical protein
MSDQDEIRQSSAELLEYVGTDAEKWTEQFLAYTNLNNAGPDFVSTVHSWFANAIETGRTAGHSSAFEEMKHAAKNMGFDTSDVYTPGQLIEFVHTFRGDLQ